jgi:TolA-binding protein
MARLVSYLLVIALAGAVATVTVVEDGRMHLKKRQSAAVHTCGGMPRKRPAPAGVQAEQVLFGRGVTAFQKGHYSTALAAFEKFLKIYPASRMAADAALYRADCYLKLAGQGR